MTSLHRRNPPVAASIARAAIAAIIAASAIGLAQAQPMPRNEPAAKVAAPARPAQPPAAQTFDFYDNQPRSYGRWHSGQYNNQNGGS